MTYGDIKTYTFRTTTNDVKGNSIAYSSFPIKGDIIKVAYKRGNWLQAGSLFIATSGGTEFPAENIFYTCNTLNADTAWYPRIPTCNISGATAVSGNFLIPNTINDVLCIVGSGVGSPAVPVLSGLTIFYR